MSERLIPALTPSTVEEIIKSKDHDQMRLLLLTYGCRLTLQQEFTVKKVLLDEQNNYGQALEEVLSLQGLLEEAAA